MANEFIIRNGFISRANSELTGSLHITSHVSASSYIKIGGTSDDILLGDGSTTSLSGISIDSISGLVSGSSQINYPEISNIPAGIISGSTQLNGSTFTNIIASGSFSGSFVGDGSGLTGIGSLTTWQIITGSTYTAIDGGKYIADSATRVVFALPTTNNTDESIRVTGKGVGGWQIDVPGSWILTFVDEAITDNIQSNEFTDSVELICTGNNAFHVISSTGNITFNNL